MISMPMISREIDEPVLGVIKAKVSFDIRESVIDIGDDIWEVISTSRTRFFIRESLLEEGFLPLEIHW